MAKTYKPFSPQDFAVVPFNANKQYKYTTSASAVTNKLQFIKCQWTSESISTYTTSSAPNFSSAHTKNPVKYSQIDLLYYKYSK